MDALAWLWWGIVRILEIALTLAWFLVGGWVSTLVQLAILVGLVFAMRFGWRRAPGEMWTRVRSAGRFIWTWARFRDPNLAPVAAAVVRSETPARSRQDRRSRRRRPGDVNLSTLLTLALLVGLLAVGAM